jgi:hypothetical protein
MKSFSNQNQINKTIYWLSHISSYTLWTCLRKHHKSTTSIKKVWTLWSTGSRTIPITTYNKFCTQEEQVLRSKAKDRALAGPWNRTGLNQQTRRRTKWASATICSDQHGPAVFGMRSGRAWNWGSKTEDAETKTAGKGLNRWPRRQKTKRQVGRARLAHEPKTKWGDWPRSLGRERESWSQVLKTRTGEDVPSRVERTEKNGWPRKSWRWKTGVETERHLSA